jgi:dTDP-glucose 4,6-dehydratase
MAKILITGGAGFIGTNFVRHWRSVCPEDEILVLDALTYAGTAMNLVGLDQVRLTVGDIGDTEMVQQLLRDNDISTIVHFAAESHVDRSISGPAAFIETNVVGTHSLLMAAKAEWLDRGSGRPHRFHHVSTDEVYGSLGSDDPAFSETTPYSPNSPYSASKAGSDHLVRAYHHTFGLDTTISNCSNNYGPYQYPEKLIPLFLLNCLRGIALPIYGDGMNVRDWLHVEDHCQGIEKVISGGRAGQVYNIGGGQELTNIAVIDTICSALDRAFMDIPSLGQRYPAAPAAAGRPSASLKTYVTDRQGHDRRYAIDASKISNELGYSPQRDFTAGFAETLDWYLENEDWWSALLSGTKR